MPTCVGGCGLISGTDVSVSRTCTTQNVRSATMGEPSAAVAAQSISRMIFVFFLVWGYCLTGCLGVFPPPPPPAVISKALDTAGHLDSMTQLSDVIADDDSFTTLQSSRNARGRGTSSDLETQGYGYGHSIRDRELNLREVLDNLAMLRQKHQGWRSGTLTEADVNRKILENLLQNKLKTKHKFNNPYETYYRPSSDSLLTSATTDERAIRLPFQFIAQLDLILSSSDDSLPQHVLADWSTQTHGQPIRDNDHFMLFDEDRISRKNDVTQEDKGLNIPTLNWRNSGPRNLEEGIDMEGENNRARRVSDKRDTFQKKADPTNDAILSEGHLYNTENFDDRFVSKDTSSHHGGKDFASRDPSRQGFAGTAKNTDSLESLIHKTVRKMENLLAKRSSNYGDYVNFGISRPPSENDGSQELDDKYLDLDNDPSPTSHNLDDRQLFKGNSIVDDNPDEEYYDKLFSQHRPEQYDGDDDIDDVTAAVIAAVTSQTVPKDTQFWRNVSDYLDSNYYLSRTRRSPRRDALRNRFRQHMRARLSITYGHVMPCEYKDRFYCMNGGTCVYVGALDIKTCRCPIGYTGVRCEMIDQEYILSLLTNSIIFS